MFSFVLNISLILFFGEQGRRNENIPPTNVDGYHMWVENVIGSRPCSVGFSLGSPVFLLHSYQQCKFHLDLESLDEKPSRGCDTTKYYLFINLSDIRFAL